MYHCYSKQRDRAPPKLGGLQQSDVADDGDAGAKDDEQRDSGGAGLQHWPKPKPRLSDQGRSLPWSCDCTGFNGRCAGTPARNSGQAPSHEPGRALRTDRNAEFAACLGVAEAKGCQFPRPRLEAGVVSATAPFSDAA